MGGAASRFKPLDFKKKAEKQAKDLKGQAKKRNQKVREKSFYKKLKMLWNKEKSKERRNSPQKMNIEIGKGLLNIKFGMKENEIIQTLGNPDKIINFREDGKEYLYNNFKLKLFFDIEENNRLYSIEVFNKSDTFLSTEVIGMSVEKLLSFMKKNGYINYEINDFDYFDTIYFSDCNTSFTVEFNEITSYEFSPLFKDDEIIWP